MPPVFWHVGGIGSIGAFSRLIELWLLLARENSLFARLDDWGFMAYSLGWNLGGKFMRLTIVLLFALAGALSVPPGGSIAQDPPRDTPSKDPAPAIDAEQVKQAKALLASQDRRVHVVIAGLRHLLRNPFEDDLFAGRWRRVCPIESFENAGAGALDASELWRLWAVLESGMARNPALDAKLARLALTPSPEISNELAPAGLYMLVIRAAARRMSVKEAAKLLENARQTLSAAKNAANVCSPQSYWATGEAVSVEWFSNHFWRAIINRCALDIGLQAEFKQWGRDLDFLRRSHIEGLGWCCQKGQPPEISEDLNANVLAMAAFGLASGAPPGQFTRPNLNDIETASRLMPDVIDRLQKTYNEPFGGGRLAFIMACMAAPKGLNDAAQWRNALHANYLEAMKAGSLAGSTTALASALGFSQRSGREDPMAEITESVLLLAPAFGGFLSQADGPLAKMELAEVGRVMHAMALVEASTAPASRPATTIELRANAALDKARKFLVTSQNPDGSFPNDMWGGPKSEGTGVQCLAVMALLHAGEPRDSATVRKAMSFLESRNFAMKRETYEASLQLMLLEKYFEKEIAAAGMFTATNLNEYNTARNKLVELMPRNYRELAKARAKLLIEKREFDLDGYSYSCGGPLPPKPPKTPPSTPPRPITGPRAKPKPPKPVTMDASKSTQDGWDNSNSVYALMGLKAACMLAINVPSSVFRYELERIIGEAELDHSLAHVPMERPWKTPPPKDPKRAAKQTRVSEHVHCFKFFYRPDWAKFFNEVIEGPPIAKKDDKEKKDEKDGKGDVGSGSFGCSAGLLASLGICFDELSLRGEWGKGEFDGELERFGDQILWGGLSWLSLCMLKPAANYKNRWQADMTKPRSAALDGVGFYNDAWALSRASIQLGAVELAGGIDWYAVLARDICDKQLPDGSWGLENALAPSSRKPALCNTAFAILVLARAYQPVLSGERRGHDAPPRGPAKTSEPGPKPTEPAPKPKTEEPEKTPTTGEK